MATINKCGKLKIWQKARMLCQEVFALTEQEKFCRYYKLKDQINGSSGAVMDNIAEGLGRQSNVEFINFLTISYGSALEVKSQLYRALDRNYLPKTKFDELELLIDELGKINASRITYLNRNAFRGQKFKARQK